MNIIDVPCDNAESDMRISDLSLDRLRQTLKAAPKVPTLPLGAVITHDYLDTESPSAVAGRSLDPAEVTVLLTHN